MIDTGAHKILPSRAPRLGLIVNPIAGMGGRVGLKGTDGEEILKEAVARGADLAAPTRAATALRRLVALFPTLHVRTVAGAMGEDAAGAVGFDPVVIHQPATPRSTSADTCAAATALARDGVDLLLFAGGDGTARDIITAVGECVPVLGIPAGVKMHSAVFGTSPGNAGLLAASFLSGSATVVLRKAEVMDLDEAALRNDRMAARLYGYASSPYERRLSQNAKAGAGPDENVVLDAIARDVAAAMMPGHVYILGPGTTTRRVSRTLGLASTLLGVDAVLDGTVLGLDLDERALLRAIDGRPAQIIVGVLGGQGSLFGRGNQQISAEVIRRIGRDRIIVMATMEKLIALQGAPLRVDTGDAEIDRMLTGHIRVATAPGRSVPMRVTV